MPARWRSKVGHASNAHTSSDPGEVSPTRKALARRFAVVRAAVSRARYDFDHDARMKRRRTYVLDAVLLILVLALTYGAMRLRNPPQGSSDGGHVNVVPKVDMVARAEKWLSTSLPAGARIGVDASVARDLAGTKRPNVDVLSKASTDRPVDDFIVATSELRAIAAGVAAVSQALASSRPVAVFGRGDARVEVRQVDSDGPAALARRWRQDVSDRALAGPSLLRNPRVRADASPRAVLQRGGLDLRAVVLLGLLAAKTDVRITALPSDPAEAAAGMPARFLRTSIADPGTALTAVLAMLPPTYRPSRITVLPARVRQFEWPVAAAPVKSLS
jgi:hypothetical protein